MMERRTMLAMLVASFAVAVPSQQLRAMELAMEEIIPEFGLITHVLVQEGQRAEYIRTIRQMSQKTGEYGGISAFEDANHANGVVTVKFWRDERARTTARGLMNVAPLAEMLDQMTGEVLTRTEVKIPKPE